MSSLSPKLSCPPPTAGPSSPSPPPQAPMVNSNMQWTPLEFFEESSLRRAACLVLNGPEHTKDINRHNIAAVWGHARRRICVDGGANFVWNHFIKDFVDMAPDMILGDMDSVTSHTRETFTQQTCEFISLPDQNFTDFTKSVRHMSKEAGNEWFLVIGGLQGRFDHVLGSMNTLYILRDKMIVMMDGQSMAWLLVPGKHTITYRPPESSYLNYRLTRVCGFASIGSTARVTTTGFKYNLENAESAFGGVVSTSNAFVDDICTIETDQALVFTCEFEKNAIKLVRPKKRREW